MSGSERDSGEAMTWSVAMLGPSRVGKTSLLTSLRVAGRAFFAGTPVRVDPVNEVTRRAFNRNDDLMKGELNARRFSPESLPGDAEEHRYGLSVSAGADKYDLVLEFRDYPGRWISNEYRSRVEEILADCPAVIIPIDATLLMEAGTEHKRAMVEGLALSDVEDNVVTWAKRRRSAGDPATLILAPVKCEAYFADNGGRHDRSGQLFDRVVAAYADTVAGYLAEYGGASDLASAGLKAEVLYAPVDTVGPIELMDVEWSSREGRDRIRPVYRVRSDSTGAPRRRVVKGAEPILAHLVRDALGTLRERLDFDRREIEAKIDSNTRDTKRRRSNWFKSLWDDLSGAASHRANDRQRLLGEETLANENIRALADGINSVSPSGEYARVRPWP